MRFSPSDELGFPTAWEKARGIWMIDYICYLLLARAPVEELAGAIAEDAEVWEQDVLGRQILVRRDALFVFRLRGHRWSIAASRSFGWVPYGAIGYAWEKRLSRRLRQPIIVYGVSDTSGWIGYTLVEGGEVVEDFFAEDQGSRPAPERSWIQSARRNVELSQVGDIYDFVGEFFLEQDAFDPAIDFEYFLGRAERGIGESVVVENPGFSFVTAPDWEAYRSTPQIERVDYLVLRQNPDRRHPSSTYEGPAEPP
jgi:hypothetical protein